MSKTNYLFVYGTLLGDVNHEMSSFLAQHSKFVAKGYFRGKLYKIDWYPGAVLSDFYTDKVYGSIHKISNSRTVFQVLDDYEGVNDYLYKRQLIDVFLDTETSIKSWVYLYNRPISNAEQISSGDFMKPN